MQDFLNSISLIAASDPDIEVLWLYGSRAKGTHLETSDFDLAVAFADFRQDRVERRLRPELLALDWAEELQVNSSDISIVDINLAPVPLATAIVTQGRVLHCKNPLRLATEENRITSMWEIDHLHHLKTFTPPEDRSKFNG